MITEGFDTPSGIADALKQLRKMASLTQAAKEGEHFQPYPGVGPGVFHLNRPHPSDSAWTLRVESHRPEGACRSKYSHGAGGSERRPPGRSAKRLRKARAGAKGSFGGLAVVHRIRVMSWTFWVVVSLRRHPGKVRALVLPRCCCSSNSPKSRFLKVAMT